MKAFLKRYLPKWIHYLYNRIISRRIIARRHSNWFDLEWKKHSKNATLEEWRKVYDLTWSHWEQPDLSTLDIERILRLLDEQCSILDVGCGDGYLLSFMWNGKRKLFGIDISEKALELAKKRLPKDVTLLNGNIEDLPFDDHSFDVVTCTHTLEHVRNLEKSCLELKRVTRNQLIVLVPVQSYLPYTDDYHLHFFSTESELANAFQLPSSLIERYTVPAGQCAYQGDIFFMVWNKNADLSGGPTKSSSC